MGRNGGMIVKVLTAAVFVMTIASIFSGNVGNINNKQQQRPTPKDQTNEHTRTSSPIPNTHLLIPELQSHQQTEHISSSKSNTVSTYIQDKIAAWKLWQSTNKNSPPSPTNILPPNSTTTNAPTALSELNIPIPSSSSSPIRPTILKLSILTSWDQSASERALFTHFYHATLHAYPFHILRTPILADIWSKPAYILSHLLHELAKPPGERAQWLFWFDADTIILNAKIPLHVFLPPATFDDVNLLVGHDWNGLNNGVYPIRVHPWSVELLTTILTYPIYKPEEPLPLRDQTAMANILQMPRFKRHTAVVPMHWFNAYHRVINASAEDMMAKPGDLLVHLAGVPDRFAVMEEWLRKVEDKIGGFEVEYAELGLREEIGAFWRGFEAERKRVGRLIGGLMSEVEEIEREFRKILEQGVEMTMQKEVIEGVEQVLERKKKVWEDFYAKQDLETVRNVTQQLEEVSGRRAQGDVSSGSALTVYRPSNSFRPWQLSAHTLL